MTAEKRNELIRAAELLSAHCSSVERCTEETCPFYCVQRRECTIGNLDTDDIPCTWPDFAKEV